MPNPISLDLIIKPQQSLRQLQRLIMSRQMQQALHLLQVPVMELAPLVDMELEQNPILEYSEDQDEGEVEQTFDQEEREENIEKSETELDFSEENFALIRRLDDDFQNSYLENPSFIRQSAEESLSNVLEKTIPDEPSRFENLMWQAKEVFKEEGQFAMAELLIGSLDERGFLTTSLEELSILHGTSKELFEELLTIIQTFYPPGIAARSLQESFLIQLKMKGLENSISYRIVEKHFDDLLHNRLPIIQRGLNCSIEQIEKAIDDEIFRLDLHPGNQSLPNSSTYITADITLRQEGENLMISINDDSFPKLRLNRHYLKILDDESTPKETKDFIKQKIASAKWFIKNILQRNDTLEKIAQALIRLQREFLLNPNGKLVPLTMKKIADEFQMHESTIARAVANKYMETPRGLLPLRYFFTNALTTQEGPDISVNTAKDLLQKIIAEEDKQTPLSDQQISIVMRQQGIICARRTVTKYRTILNIGTANQRRRFQDQKL